MKYNAIVLCILLLIGFRTLGQDASDIIVEQRYYGETLNGIFMNIGKTYFLDMDYFKEDMPSGIVPGRSYLNVSLPEVLQDLCSENGLHFKIVDERIIIRKADVEITDKARVYPRQQNFDLSGVIRDKASGEALPFAQVVVQGTTNGAVTNADGYFTLIKVPSDSMILEVVYVGYEKGIIQLTPKLIAYPIIIELVQRVKELNTVEITAEREDLMRTSEGIGEITIKPKDISNLPSLGEKDIFRTFQLMPGVSGSNESSAGLYVRGGTPDQNLILYDGFTVYHQEHLFGLFSAFNTNALKDVKLFKGGFESLYGGRLSSVVDIIGKTGNDREFNFGAGISLLSFLYQQP